MKIYKYGCLPGLFTLMLPEGTNIIDVHSQKGGMFFWATVNLDKPLRQYEFIVLGTGFDVDLNTYFYRGTAHDIGEDRDLVFHLFQKYQRD